jgi:hypothetical protein
VFPINRCPQRVGTKTRTALSVCASMFPINRCPQRVGTRRGPTAARYSSRSKFPINRCPQRVGTGMMTPLISAHQSIGFQSIGVPNEWGQRPPRGPAPQAIRGPFAHPPTLATLPHRVNSVENAEFHCAAGPRADRRQHWVLRDRGGVRGNRKGQEACADHGCPGLSESRTPLAGLHQPPPHRAGELGGHLTPMDRSNPAP